MKNNNNNNSKSKYKDFSSLALAIEEKWGHTYEDLVEEDPFGVELPGYDKAETEEEE